jgi:hypothetical protein
VALVGLLLAAPAARANEPEDDVTGAISPTLQTQDKPGPADLSRPIFTRDVAPLCRDRKKLVAFSRWLMTYRTYDPALSRARFGCVMAHDGERVTLVGAPTAGHAEAAEVSWLRGDGSLAHGVTWVARLRN